MTEWRQSSLDGTFSETFACGTAAIITPIGAVRSRTQDWTIGDGGMGPVTRQLRQRLLDIQHGTGPDPFGWMHKIG